MSNDREIDRYLSGIYSTPDSPASFSGIQKLWGFVKNDKNRPEGITKKRLSEWIRGQQTYQVHTLPKTRVRSESIVVEFLDQMWEGDILQLPIKSKENKSVKYLAVFVDVFSRFAWVRLLKSKSSNEMAEALKDIFKEGRKCKELRTDAGGEFMGNSFQDLLKEEKIYHFVAYGETKAAFVERLNRTIQNKLYKFLYEKDTFKFIDVIHDIVRSYNNTVHSSTGYAPADVTDENAYELYEKVYMPILDKKAKRKSQFSFEVGQLVRLSLSKGKFRKGYEQSWSEEVFEIYNRIYSIPSRYKIQDLLGERVKGSFYSPELKKINQKNREDIQFKIEKILYTRKVKGKKLSKIKWAGYPSKFNSLIPYKDIANYKRIK